MSETTFLGTPLSKYDIDNIEINVKNKRCRNYLESKELRYRQNREQIKKNKPKILYTVDTEEGWIPSDFKSSKTNRANYNFQTLSNFTDQDDMDIISMKVLNSIRLKERENELYRIVKSILKSEGFIERIYGPQLPSINSLYPNYTRDLFNITGVGFNIITTTDTTEENPNEIPSVTDSRESGTNTNTEEKNSNKVAAPKGANFTTTVNNFTEEKISNEIPLVTNFGESNTNTIDGIESNIRVESMNGLNNKLYWICEVREEINRPKTKIMTGDKKYHVWDREEDLMDIKNYYKGFYKFIVKPLQNINSENNLLNKYTKSLQFIKYSNTVTGTTETTTTNSNMSTNDTNTPLTTTTNTPLTTTTNTPLTTTTNTPLTTTTNTPLTTTTKSVNGDVDIHEKKMYRNKIRIIKIYQFNKELLNKFNIKFKSIKSMESTNLKESVGSTNLMESVGSTNLMENMEDMEIKLPSEIYKNVFGN